MLFLDYAKKQQSVLEKECRIAIVFDKAKAKTEHETIKLPMQAQSLGATNKIV